MIKDNKLQIILANAIGGISPNKEQCLYLLSFSEMSMEASFIRAVSNEVLRKATDNSAIILGQIGVDISKCAGGCKFCTFGEGHTNFPETRLSEEELVLRVKSFCDKDDLYGLYLMTMQDYDLANYLNSIKTSKKIVSPHTQIWANIGDSDIDTFRELKKAGVYGVYHVCRLGEGSDTNLQSKDRIKTMENALDVGLKLYTCCEPIGPEHTTSQLVENIFIGIELGCTQHAAMRRVAVANSPFAKYGQITELRLAQIVAVVALASFDNPKMAYCGVHEPNQLAYVSGANIITAETGANPRDTSFDTTKNRGMDMNDCRKMLWESGFKYLRRGDESKIPLELYDFI